MAKKTTRTVSNPVSVKDRDDLYAKMKANASDTMSFGINRVAEHKPGETFSSRAIEQINESIALFVVSRIDRHWVDKEAIGPTSLNVEVIVKVTVDGQTVTVPDDEYPWYVVDGAHRDN